MVNLLLWNRNPGRAILGRMGEAARYTDEELAEALRQYRSMISKLEKALAGLSETAKAQRTLATRRLAALRIGESLIIALADKSEVNAGDLYLTGD